ncbi:MAG: hypothetical protein L0207_00755 [Chlamydiae bacterium]|nr:hypothetical protein [Chlamydiota bacterium]
MKRAYEYSIDYSLALLSAFDIMSSLTMNNISSPSNGIQYDLNQLNGDLKALEEDYRNAREKILRKIDNE